MTPACLTHLGTSTACKKIAEIIYLAENDPLMAPALEEGLRKNEAFMHTPAALECYIEVARIGASVKVQSSRQLHHEHEPPQYSPLYFRAHR